MAPPTRPTRTEVRRREQADRGVYPARWEADVVLADGGTVHVRPIRPGDASGVEALHHRLSDETVYLRFFTLLPRLSPALLERLTNVDYVDRMALVAELGDQLVAVARYDVLPTSPSEAEVAFVVDDAHQGRGLGTLLLEHLAAIAREHGIRCFVADTLPNNRRMLGVFRDAGFGVERTFADGVVRVTFPIDPTPASEAAIEDRDRRATARSVQRLLAPRTVAVVGAGRRPGTLGHEVVRNLVAGGFVGPVYPVHHEARSVAGIRAYPSVLDVPDDIDLAVVAVPAEGVPTVVEECARKRVGGLVVISSGFADAGPEGEQAEQRLVETARRHGMRIIGPNTMGVVNTSPEVALRATFAPVRPLPGPVGFVSQSGALGITVLDEMTRRGLGISTFVAVGNKADVSGNDLLQYWEEDDDTAVVLMYLESFGNPRKFSRVAREVSRRKPIVVVKSGRRAPEREVEALFLQAGVLRVDTLEQLFDVAHVLATQPLPAGRRVGIVTDAGGPASLAADACEAEHLSVTRLTDLGFAAGATEYEAALDATLADDEVDAVIAIFIPPLPQGEEDVAAAIRRAADRSPGKPVVLTFLSRRGEVGGLPAFAFPEQAASALARLADRADWLRRPEGEVPSFPDVDGVAARMLVDTVLAERPEGTDLDDESAGQLLGYYGIRVGGAPGPGVEVAVEISQDRLFGHVVGFRLAGRLPELLGDVAYRALPLTDLDAAEAVRSIRGSSLLFGDDGRPAADVAGLSRLLLRVAALVDDVPEVAELVLEPVVAADSGVTVVRAHVRLVPWEPHPERVVRRLR